MTNPALALPDSPPELPKEIEEGLIDVRSARRNMSLTPLEETDRLLASLRSVIAKHLLTAEEARAIIEYLDMGGRVERSERAHTVAKSADAKLRGLSGSSRGEE